MAKLDKRLKYQNDDEKPVTISMRLPKELHTRLVRYAMEHRQPISELVRDGLEWRLGDGDPRGLGDASTKDDEAYYMSNTANALADMRQALARQEAQIQAIVQALERQTGIPHPSITHKGQTESVPELARTTGGPGGEKQQTARVPETQGEETRQTETPPYDTTRDYLGKLCPAQHDYHGTGQSLRRRQKGDCRECARLAKQAAREAKRQQVTA